MKDNKYISSAEKFRTEDPAAAEELRRIDRECASCLYKAGLLSEKDVLAAVIENELSDTERKIIKQYWFCGNTYNSIAQAYGIPRETVRRASENAGKKIYNSMKYVVLYNYLLDGRHSLPGSFGFKIIRCIDGKELVA